MVHSPIHRFRRRARDMTRPLSDCEPIPSLPLPSLHPSTIAALPKGALLYAVPRHTVLYPIHRSWQHAHDRIRRHPNHPTKRHRPGSSRHQLAKILNQGPEKLFVRVDAVDGVVARDGLLRMLELELGLWLVMVPRLRRGITG